MKGNPGKRQIADRHYALEQNTDFRIVTFQFSAGFVWKQIASSSVH